MHRWAWPLALLTAFSAGLPLSAQEDARSSALQFESQGDVQEAMRAWSEVLRQNAASPEALVHLGLLEARQEQYPEAIRFYLRALQLAPDSPGVRLNLGLAYFKSGQLGAAIAPFTEELRRHPENNQLLVLLGLTHFGIGDNLVAIPYLERAAALDVTNVPLRQTLMQSCFVARQFRCVDASYNELTALHAPDAQTQLLEAVAKAETGDLEQASTLVHAALAADPQQPGTQFALGWLAWKSGRWQEAAQALQQELASGKPVPAATHLLLADCALKLADWPRAEAELQQASQGEPGSSLLHRDLAAVKAHAGDRAGATSESALAERLQAAPTPDLSAELAPLLGGDAVAH